LRETGCLQALRILFVLRSRPFNLVASYLLVEILAGAFDRTRHSLRVRFSRSVQCFDYESLVLLRQVLTALRFAQDRTDFDHDPHNAPNPLVDVVVWSIVDRADAAANMNPFIVSGGNDFAVDPFGRVPIG
jgi:hypothetical protein